MPDEAETEEHNGDIWSREATKHGAIPAAKIGLFLLGISIKCAKRGKVALSSFHKVLLAFLNIDDRTALVLSAGLARMMGHAERAAVGALYDAGGRELPGGRTSHVTSLTRYFSFRDCHVDTSCLQLF